MKSSTLSSSTYQETASRDNRIRSQCLKFIHLLINAFKSFYTVSRKSITSAYGSLWTVLTRDPKKTIYSFKVAVALTLAFQLVLVTELYNIVGNHVMWAIMTVIVILELTMGATLSKGCNRGEGTLIAGFLAALLGQLAQICGGIGNDIVIALSVLVVGVVATFARLQPQLKPYAYGFQISLITFCYIMVSQYQEDDPWEIAKSRFLIILLGAAIGLSVNIFLLPLWSGDELHDLISNNFDSVADSLEVCVDEYLRGTVLERVPTKIFMGQAADDPVYKNYRTVLSTTSREESLALFASWEIPHGRFRMFRYPWNNYVKLGAVLRHCTYSVVALHGCLRSAIQAPLDVRVLFANEIQNVSKESSQVLRELGKCMREMRKCDYMTILDGVRHAVEMLQQSLYLHSYLLVRSETSIPTVEELPLIVVPEKKDVKWYLGDSSTSLDCGFSENTEHEASKCFKKLYSWPHRPIDNFEFDKGSLIRQCVKVLESSSALSLGTFATLLIEVASRLDYLVVEVEELGQLANFTEYVNDIHDMDKEYRKMGSDGTL